MNEIEPYRVAWYAAGAAQPTGVAPYLLTYPVALCDGSCLELPLRRLPGGDRAIALLMSNQTQFAVEDALVERLTQQVRPLAPEAIVGIPTMGLDYARGVAKALGQQDYIALGLSRKFWYEAAWSEPVVSSTSPDQRKSIFVDPGLLDRVRGRRVVVIDDVMNTGSTVSAAVRLLSRAGAQIDAIAVVLTEGDGWRHELACVDVALERRVHALGHIPLFRRVEGGWQPC